MPTDTNNHYATCKVLLDELKCNQGEYGYTQRIKYRVDGIAQDFDYNALVTALGSPVLAEHFAMNLPDHTDIRQAIPQRGDQRQMYIGYNGTTPAFIPVFCTNRAAYHVNTPGSQQSPPAPNSCIVVVDFEEIGIPLPDGTGSTYMWLTGATINGGTVPVRTNYSWTTSGTNETFGRLMQIYYKPGTPNYDYSTDANLTSNVASGSVYSQYVNLAGLESITNFTYTVREIVHPAATNANLRSPEAKVQYFDGSVNSGSIWGFPAETLRMRAMISQFDVYRNLQILNPDASIAIRAYYTAPLTVGIEFSNNGRIQNPATATTAPATQGAKP